ncbi:phytoene desaturase family protein [Marinococcus halotolerans]|uniref:phytoene desaturase family protein n=1 Tax=Marinococcus halotolerans TaxID=301092 RepID=UPI0003B4541D|nr:phytoene desaturase family protein [Marinococcus halotolerans]
MTTTAVIGAGLGGLSAAIVLAKTGQDVTVYEKNERAGGKLRPFQLGSHAFDYGPNTITMPDIFRRVVAFAGREPEDLLPFRQLPEHTRNYFPDGSTLEVSSDAAETRRAIARLSEEDASRYDDYLREVKRLYTLATENFLQRTFESPLDYLSPGLALALRKVRPATTMHAFHHRFFKHPDVQQAFDRYATYIGSSPYDAPATFALIAHLELADGVYYTPGGNEKIADVFYETARELGVTFSFNDPVHHVSTRNGRAQTVYAASGSLEVDSVVLNGDLLSQYPLLFPAFSQKSRTVPNRPEPSISAFVIMAGLNTRLPQLKHHQVYFSADYPEEFEQLKRGSFPYDPTVYISNSSHSDRSQSPDGDNLFILINAPALPGGAMTEEEKQSYKNLVYDKLEKFDLFLRPHIVEEQVLGPSYLEETFGAYKGSIYGLASNRRQDAFLRPFNRSQDLKNVYFAGGSTHPGGGSPMVTTSGVLAASALLKDNGILLDFWGKT